MFQNKKVFELGWTLQDQQTLVKAVHMPCDFPVLIKHVRFNAIGIFLSQRKTAHSSDPTESGLQILNLVQATSSDD